MIYFLLFSGLEVTAVLLGFLKRPFIQIPWMSQNYTTALKGISMLTVLWVHVGACYGIGGIQFIGTVGVSLFIIFSGYGLELSVSKNGLNDYWKKRILHVMLPYWLVEGIGLLISGRLTFRTYVLDCLFIKPAVGPGWFMQYIMICYLLFYLVSLAVQIIKPKDPAKLNNQLLYGVFLIWLVVDSLLFADPNMPFLKARQMLCFPFGVSIARNKEALEKATDRPEPVYLGGLIGILFMGVTQLPFVKELPYLYQNVLSLFTVFPLAITVLAITKRHSWLLNNCVLKQIGLVSFEIYLVHAFTIEKLQMSLTSFCIFLMLTTIGVFVLHIVLRKVNRIWSI